MKEKDQETFAAGAMFGSVATGLCFAYSIALYVGAYTGVRDYGWAAGLGVFPVVVGVMLVAFAWGWSRGAL